MRSPIFRATVVFVVVGLGSLLCGRLLVFHLPANRTTEITTLRILIAGVLMIGGPIVGLVFGVGYFCRNGRDSGEPRAVSVVDQVGLRRRRRVIFVAVGIPVGLTMIGLFGGMIVPAAWLAGGGDMPPGHGNPADMRVGGAILCVIIGLAAVGLVLLVTSIVVGIGLLMKGE